MLRHLPAPLAATLLLATIAGLALVALALPRTLAGFARLPGNAVVDRLSDGEEVSESAYARLAESRAQALAFHGEAEDYSDLAMAKLGLAREAGRSDSGPAQALYEEALGAARQAVERNPADGYGWMRLAYAEYYVNGVTPRLAGALEMVLRALPFDRRLVYVAVEFALIAWPELSAEAQARAGAQIRFAVRWDAARIARLAKQHFARPIVRRALYDEPGLLAYFDQVYRTL